MNWLRVLRNERPPTDVIIDPSSDVTSPDTPNQRQPGTIATPSAGGLSIRGGQANSRFRESFARQHLKTAKYFASECDVIEVREANLTENQRMQHRAYATGCVLSTIAFLETSINELYLEAVEKITAPLVGLRPEALPLLAEFWEHIDRTPILHKYQTALIIGGVPIIPKGDALYQNAESIIKLRDALVHYKPEWNDEQGAHQKLEDRLAGHFLPNRYSDPKSLWFPDRCLGSGCSHFCIEVAETFSKRFCTDLRIPERH